MKNSSRSNDPRVEKRVFLKWHLELKIEIEHDQNQISFEVVRKKILWQIVWNSELVGKIMQRNSNWIFDICL